MGTLYEKFPGVPRKAIRIPPASVVFTGSLAGGYFNFDSRVLFYSASVNDRIIIDGIELAANIDQLEFSRAIVEPFKAQIWRGGNGTPILQQPFCFAAFNQGRNFAADFEPTNVDSNGVEEMYLSLSGSLKQTAPLADMDTVKIFGTASLYVLNKDLAK